SNPLVGAIVAGGTLAATGVGLPDPVARLLGFLGGAAGPAALFALGGALAAQRLDRAAALAAAGVAAAKLLLNPVLVWCVLAGLLRLDPLWVQAGVLLAALPSAGSTHVFAQRYGADAGRVSAAILLSTTVSALTVPVVAWLVVR
ncbi:MAG: AEC family transporter, partial [Rhodospirillaceae bacterium]|nr:AEC family transporter [Rhodospirillaceae bacterium]